MRTKMCRHPCWCWPKGKHLWDGEGFVSTFGGTKIAFLAGLKADLPPLRVLGAVQTQGDHLWGGLKVTTYGRLGVFPPPLPVPAGGLPGLFTKQRGYPHPGADRSRPPAD